MQDRSLALATLSRSDDAPHMALPSSNCSSALPTAIANRPAAYTILALLSLVALYALWTGALGRTDKSKIH
jgi:hypothetical protein